MPTEAFESDEQAGELVPADVDAAADGVDFAALARNVIDRLIVDGEVGPGKAPKHSGQLALLAFGINKPSPDQLAGLRAALWADPRFVSGKNGYTFRPELSPDSTAQPSTRAIVGGTARCSEAERARVLLDMEALAIAVYEFAPGPIILRTEVRDMLYAAGLRVSPEQFSGLLEYFARDRRFIVMPDGQIVLVDSYKGDASKVEPLREVPDLPSVVSRILPIIPHSPDGILLKRDLLGKLRSRGFVLPIAQVAQINAILAELGYERVRPGVFKNPNAVVAQPEPPEVDEAAQEDHLTRKLRRAGVTSGRAQPNRRGGRRG